MASCPITSWQIDGETMETVSDFIFLGSKITANDDCSHEDLLLWRKVMINLDSILKSRDFTLPTKVHLVKSYGFSCGHVWMWELDCEEGWALDGGAWWAAVHGVAKSRTQLSNWIELNWTRFVGAFLPRSSVFKFHGCTDHSQWF